MELWRVLDRTKHLALFKKKQTNKQTTDDVAFKSKSKRKIVNLTKDVVFVDA